eukprot:PhF_6_TR13711/c2_g3_i1/m.22158
MDNLVSVTGDPFIPPLPSPESATFWVMCETIMFGGAVSTYETFLEKVMLTFVKHGSKQGLTIEETGAVVLYTWDFKRSGVLNPFQRLNKECAERNLDNRVLPFYWNLVQAYRKLPKVKVEKLYRGLRTSIVDIPGSSYRVGKNVCIVAFTSTSRIREEALKFLPTSGRGTLILYEG